MRVGIIILAAGASSRMKTPKLSLSAFNKTLLQITLDAASGTPVEKIIIVSGAHELPPITSERHSRISIVFNKTWASGIGSSIKLGLRTLLDEEPSIDGALFMVADQPYISARILNQLLKKNDEQDNIVACKYADTAGVPAVFPKKYFKDIFNLSDQHGAKALITSFKENVTVLDFPEGAVDLDTPEEYERFIKSITKAE